MWDHLINIFQSAFHGNSSCSYARVCTDLVQFLPPQLFIHFFFAHHPHTQTYATGACSNRFINNSCMNSDISKNMMYLCWNELKWYGKMVYAKPNENSTTPTHAPHHDENVRCRGGNEMRAVAFCLQSTQSWLSQSKIMLFSISVLKSAYIFLLSICKYQRKFQMICASYSKALCLWMSKGNRKRVEKIR